MAKDRFNITPTQQRILEMLRAEGKSQAFIARTLGLHQSAVSNMANGTRAMKLEEANQLLPLIESISIRKELPVIGIAGAGHWAEAIEHADETVPAPPNVDGEPQFAVRVEGDSMDVLLPEGSYALIDPDQRELFVGKLYLLINEDGEGTLKRYRTDPARFEPVSHNPEHQPFGVESVAFRVIGRVVGSFVRY